MNEPLADDRIPVIIGVADILDRPAQIEQGREPIVLMEHALRAAQADAGVDARLLAALDALYIVYEVSWPYDDAPSLLAARLQVSPATNVLGPVGGETPIRFMHEAALAIRRGACRVAAVVGAEAQYSLNNATKAGVTLPWTSKSNGPGFPRARDKQHPLAQALGIAQPTTVYPLYENAAPVSWGQTPAQAQDESADIWSGFSAVAARTESAWGRDAFSPEQVGQPSGQNRLIAYPYTKRMVANPAVNMGAAVILSSLAWAREHGVDESRCIRVLGGAAAAEPDDYLQRDQFNGTAGQQVVLDAVAKLAGGIEQVDSLELYSCFPIVPKMARRLLDVPARLPLTTIGGLSFFGAPLNNYMTHAAIGMVRQLRTRERGIGLLYGQGGLCTKHHGLVLAAGKDPRAPVMTALTDDYSLQAEADRLRGPAPGIDADYRGPATVETFTVIYDRRGEPESAAVIGRKADGQRVVAGVPGDDAVTIARLTDRQRTPVGQTGSVVQGSLSTPRWVF